MNNGAFGENFPYTNFHDLNTDWIIKIAKDFLDQYTHIQEIIEQGKTDIENLTDSGLEQISTLTATCLQDLQDKKDALEALLQAWYDTHSADIAGQLADALEAINTTLNSTVSSFRTQAQAIGAEVIDSIPSDYTSLEQRVDALEGTDEDWSRLEYVTIPNGSNLLTPKVPQGRGIYYASNNELVYELTGYTNYKNFILPVTAGNTYYIGTQDSYPLRFWVITDNNNNIIDNGANLTDSKTIPAGGTKFYGSYLEGYNITVALGSRAESQDHNYQINLNGKLNVNVPSCPNALVQVDANKNIINTGLAYDNIIDMLLNKLAIAYPAENMIYIAPTAYGYFYNGGAEASGTYQFSIVKVESGVTYSYGRIRFISSKDELLVSADATSNYEEYTATYTGWLFLSYTKNTPSFFCKKSDYNPNIIKANEQLYFTSAFKKANLFSNGFAKTTGNIANGQSLRLARTNLSKNNFYNFSCEINSFGKVLIGNGEALNQFGNSWLEIDNTNVTFHNYVASDNTTIVAHGLNITGYLKVNIKVGSNGTAEVNIISNGSSFTTSGQWMGYGYGGYFVSSILSNLENCEFTWSSPDFSKRVWVFGDSYESINNSSRWVYYTDIDKYLISAYPGERSLVGIDAFRYALTYYGKPQTLIWCYGMNDGSDSGTPATDWKNTIEYVMQLCEHYGIELILSTTPTVPTVNNEYKNDYVRNSGYRYIDFAKAVGANSSGVWYPGMLSNDGVHPTGLGARAMYTQAMIDAPEITY